MDTVASLTTLKPSIGENKKNALYAIVSSIKFQVALTPLRKEEMLNKLLDPLQSSRVPERVVSANGYERNQSSGSSTSGDESNFTWKIGVVVIP